MPPKVMTRSAAQPIVTPRGGGTGGRVGREGRRVREPKRRKVRPTAITEPSTYQGYVRNVIVNNGRRGCTYKEFLAFNPKEYDGKGGIIIHIRIHDVAVSMAWDDFKVLMREEFCPSKEMQKLETELWNHAMAGACHAAYTDRFHELARLVPHLVTPENRRIE
ncbi:reverse transcriptase domain-containing protein, partial [Tanacetum coccineum]